MNLNRDGGNEIIGKILPKYEKNLVNPPQGKEFTQCYDVTTCKPKDEWIKIYNSVRKELSELGLDLEK